LTQKPSHALSSVHGVRVHAPVVHVKSGGQPAVDEHARGVQRCVDELQISAVPHSLSAVQPVTHVLAPLQLQRIGSQIMPFAGPPQSVSVVQLPGSLLHAPQPGSSFGPAHENPAPLQSA
jgi:hypothetical protein